MSIANLRVKLYLTESIDLTFSLVNLVNTKVSQMILDQLDLNIYISFPFILLPILYLFKCDSNQQSLNTYDVFNSFQATDIHTVI